MNSWTPLLKLAKANQLRQTVRLGIRITEYIWRETLLVPDMILRRQILPAGERLARRRALYLSSIGVPPAPSPGSYKHWAVVLQAQHRAWKIALGKNQEGVGRVDLGNEENPRWFQPVVSPVSYPDEVKLEYFPVDAKTRQRVGTGSYPRKGTQSWISITDVWPLSHDEITRIEGILRNQQPAGMTPLFLTIDLDDNSEGEAACKTRSGARNRTYPVDIVILTLLYGI